MLVFLYFRFNLCFGSVSQNWGGPSDSLLWMFVHPPSNKMHLLCIHHKLVVNLGFLWQWVRFFPIQKEDKNPFLAIGKFVNFFTHFKVTIRIDMSSFAAKRRRDEDVATPLRPLTQAHIVFYQRRAFPQMPWVHTL